MQAVSFLEKDTNFLNRWEQYMEQFPKVDTWFIIYDTSWADQKKKNKVVTFAICPAIVELDELMQCLNEDLVTDIKSRSHISKGTIQFLKNNLLFFSISIVITKPKDTIPLNAMKKMLEVMEARVCNAVTDEQKKRLKKVHELIEYTHKTGCDQKLLRKLFTTACLLSLILEFLTLHQNAKKVYWIPDREVEILFKDGVILDLLYFIYCDMMGQQQKTPLVLKEFLGEKTGKSYYTDPLIRYQDYIAGVLASVDLETGQGGSEKHQLLWKHAICNNPRVVVLKMEAGSLNGTPLSFSYSWEENKND